MSLLPASLPSQLVSRAHAGGLQRVLQRCGRGMLFLEPLRQITAIDLNSSVRCNLMNPSGLRTERRLHLPQTVRPFAIPRMVSRSLDLQHLGSEFHLSQSLHFRLPGPQVVLVPPKRVPRFQLECEFSKLLQFSLWIVSADIAGSDRRQSFLGDLQEYQVAPSGAPAFPADRRTDGTIGQPSCRLDRQRTATSPKHQAPSPEDKDLAKS